MSTAYPQLIHSFLTYAPLVFSAGAIGGLIWLRRYFLKNIPNKSALNQLKRDFSALEQDLADLSDRFTRFQKREGMRAAREEKQSQKDLLAEAQSLVSGAGQATAGPSGTSPKASLYSRLRGH